MEIKYAYRVLHLQGHKSVREPEPFAAVILCTADRDKVDDRDAEQVVAGAAVRGRKAKDLDEPLRDFIKRKGGINKCAARFARRLGRSKSNTLVATYEFLTIGDALV